MRQFKAAAVGTALSTFCSLILLSSAYARSAEPAPRTFDIRPQSLATALGEFARESQQEILFSPQVVAQKLSSGVRGTMPPLAALKILLKDSDLAVSTTANGAILVGAPGSASPDFPGQEKPAGEDSTKEGKKSSSDGFLLAQVDQGAPQGNGAVRARAPQNSPSSENQIQEVIVTAQKREERLQDVPVPVTAISADALLQQNDVRIEDYYAKVPGLSMATSDYGWPLLAIRGITTGGYTNPTVAVTVDDVPYGSSTAFANGEEVPDFDPGDLSRIEVLRGPQGTLYGASSIGGLLKFVTVDPSTDRVFGDVQSTVSDVYNGAEVGYGFRGAVNVPLTDTLALRLSAFTRQDPGYIDNVLTGQDGVNRLIAHGGRLAALWRPSEAVSVKVSALFQHSESNGSPSADVGTGLGDLEQSRVYGTGGATKTLQAYSATVTAALGAVQLTSVTGYNSEKYVDSYDLSYVLGPYVENGVPGTGFNGFGVSGVINEEHGDTDRFTQELRLSGAIDQNFEWLVGGFYDHEKSAYDQDVLAAVPQTGQVVGTFAHIPTPITFAEYAGFADLTYHFTDRFDVQLGGRESHNQQSLNESIIGPYVPAFLGVPSPVIFPKVSTSDNSFTYLLTPRFKVSPDLMLYGRLASGYRPGGPNYYVVGAPLEYGPDKTLNYELGAKGASFNHALTFDASVYYIQWRDIQLNLEDPTTAQTYFGNGGHAKSQGIELSVEAKPVDGLTIAAWVVWNDAELTQNFPTTSTAYGSAGDRLPYSSRFSGSASLDERFTLVRSWTGVVGATESYVGSREGVFASGSSGSMARQVFPAYAKTDLRAGVEQQDWKINLFVTNLTDKRGLVGGGIGAMPPYGFIYIQPRLVGLSVQKNF